MRCRVRCEDSRNVRHARSVRVMRYTSSVQTTELSDKTGRTNMLQRNKRQTSVAVNHGHASTQPTSTRSDEQNIKSRVV
jgi:hypothetical protein